MPQQSLSRNLKPADVSASALSHAAERRDELRRIIAKARDAKRAFDERVTQRAAQIEEQSRSVGTTHRAEFRRTSLEVARKEEHAKLRADLDALLPHVKACRAVAGKAPDKRTLIAVQAMRRCPSELAAALALVNGMGAVELENAASLLLADGADHGGEPSNADLAMCAALLSRASVMQASERPFTTGSLAAQFKMPTVDGSLAALADAKTELERFDRIWVDLSRNAEIAPHTKLRLAIDNGALERLPDGSELPETIQ